MRASFRSGTAAFMAVGAFAAYNFQLRIPGMPDPGELRARRASWPRWWASLFGLPSLRIKGFYLAVATLAAQFFIPWLLVKVAWFSNYSASGVITAQPIAILGYAFDTPVKKYLLVLAIVALLAVLAKNLVRSRIGRAWMAVRDMDVAAEVIGIRILRTKLIGLRRELVLLRRGRRPVRIRLSGQRANRTASISTCRSASCSWSSSAGSAASWAPSWERPSSRCCRSFWTCC